MRPDKNVRDAAAATPTIVRGEKTRCAELLEAFDPIAAKPVSEENHQ